MAILTKGTTFVTGDSATSTKLNNLVDNAAFVSGASGTTDDSTLEVNGSGRLQVKDAGITSAKLATDSVTAIKINADAVTTAKILDANVTAAKIASDAVTTAKILDANVTTAKIADANITAPKLSGAQTGTAPVYGVRAFVVFDATRNDAGGSDTANTARYLIKAGNVTSVTKTATGKFTIAFTTALPDANYAYYGMAKIQGANDMLVFRTDGGTKTTTSFQIDTMNRGGSATSPEECCISIIG
jgi:hypothetical protein